MTKRKLKSSALARIIASRLIYYYLRICYCTSRWSVTYETKETEHLIKSYILEQNKSPALVMALWHDSLALGNGIFKKLGIKNISGLISRHSDGLLISAVVRLFGFGVISGSSSKNSMPALRQIIASLQKGTHILITPDGPRGPARKVVSNISQIAMKYSAGLVAISCTSSKFSRINSWDKMIIPLPFAKIKVHLSAQQLTGDKKLDDEMLENILSSSQH